MNYIEQLESLGGEVCGGVCFVNRRIAGEFINEQFVLSPFGKTLLAELPEVKPSGRSRKVVKSANASASDEPDIE